MTLTLLSSAAEVLLATGHDPFARRSLDRPLDHAWLLGRTVAWLAVDAESGNRYLSALGAPPQVAELLTELLPELPPGQRLTVPHGTPAHLPAWVSLDGNDWDFRWLDQPPPVQPGEDAVRPIEDEGEIAALLEAANPTASARPGDPSVRRWFGIRQQSLLVTCAADTSTPAGIGHLSSIAVHPAARGHGLGRVVTAAVTRRLFDEGCDLVTLGMYADNEHGRRLYDALGFHDDHRFTSGPLRIRDRW